MQKTLLSQFVLLFFSTSLLAQSSTFSQQEEADLNMENLRFSQQVGPVNSSSAPASVSFFADMDEDGMEDDWETNNGLNPEDPFDAWGDLDNDHVLNRFEFQLGTNPQDSEQPSFTIYDENAANVDELLNQAEGGFVAVRFAEGTYSVNASHIFNDDFKIMFQGGWNSDFTEHNPAIYKTIFDGELADETLVISTIGGNTFINGGVVVEGIEFQNSAGFCLRGQMTVRGESINARVSVHNCRFFNGEAYGLSFYQRPDAVLDAYVSNCVLGNNKKGGLYSQTITNGIGRWFFDNVTIAENGDASGSCGNAEGAIDAFTSGGQLEIFFDNSIIWNNQPENFFINWASSEIYVDCNFSDVQNPPSTDKYTSENCLDTNPFFNDIFSNDFSLSENSPCIDAGVDIGLPFNDNAPDMGAIEFGTSCTPVVVEPFETEICEGETIIWQGNAFDESGTYTLTLQNDQGCDSTLTLVLEVLGLPTISLVFEDSVNLGESITSTVLEDYPEIAWSDGTTGNAFIFDSEVYGVGTHEITVTVTDVNGCTNELSFAIEVLPPNSVWDWNGGITPSVSPVPLSKSIHNELVISGLSAQKVSIEIFHLDGRMVAARKGMLVSNGSVGLGIDELEAGLYFIKISAGKNGGGVKKLIVLE